MKIVQTTQAPSVPGIYAGLSNAAYHAGPGVSKSQLDMLAKSPKHYYAHYVSLTPVRRPEATAAMQLGTALHAAVLEPEIFSQWVILPDVDGRTKEGKAAKAAAAELAEERGMPTISAALHAEVMQMAVSVNDSELAYYLEREGHAELSVYWRDEDTGLLCRCRPDWLLKNTVVDLKTTEDASPRGFQRSAYGYRYWVQAAFYLDGLAANGLDSLDFLFAAVEKRPPYVSTIYMASNELIEAGRQEYKRLLRLLKQCHDSDRWPGYEGPTGGIQFLDLPGYANERLTFTEAEDVSFDNAIA